MVKRLSDQLSRAAITGDKEFSDLLRKSVKEDLHMDLRDFSKRAGIASSTIYKIISEGRAPNMRTLRAIINCVDEIEGGGVSDFVAVIAARFVLDRIENRTFEIDGKSIQVREYPAATIEDVIIATIRAEEDGAKAIVCAPIVSSTVERVVHIPIVTIAPRESVFEAIRIAAKKASLYS